LTKNGWHNLKSIGKEAANRMLGVVKRELTVHNTGTAIEFCTI